MSKFMHKCCVSQAQTAEEEKSKSEGGLRIVRIERVIRTQREDAAAV